MLYITNDSTSHKHVSTPLKVNYHIIPNLVTQITIILYFYKKVKHEAPIYYHAEKCSVPIFLITNSRSTTIYTRVENLVFLRIFNFRDDLLITNFALLWAIGLFPWPNSQQSHATYLGLTRNYFSTTERWRQVYLPRRLSHPLLTIFLLLFYYYCKMNKTLFSFYKIILV